MAKLSDKELKKIHTMVEAEFPDDPALQEVHIARKILAKEAEASGKSFVEYIESLSKKEKMAYAKG